MNDQWRRGPLWKFVPAVVQHSPGRRLAGTAAHPILIEDPSEEDLLPLRAADGSWNPVGAVQRYGGTTRESEQLGRLIVAAAALLGLHRVRELVERLVALSNVALPRVDRMVEEPGLEARKAELEGIRGRMQRARAELPVIRARANNDLERSPDGLRLIDLKALASFVEAIVLGTEVMTKRNVRGVDFAVDICRRTPDQRFAEDWMDRALGALPGLLVFTPREYGRVLLVHADGRMAYDPVAPAPPPEVDSRS